MLRTPLRSKSVRTNQTFACSKPTEQVSEEAKVKTLSRVDIVSCQEQTACLVNPTPLSLSGRTKSTSPCVPLFNNPNYPCTPTPYDLTACLALRGSHLMYCLPSIIVFQTWSLGCVEIGSDWVRVNMCLSGGTLSKQSTSLTGHFQQHRACGKWGRTINLF